MSKRRKKPKSTYMEDLKIARGRLNEMNLALTVVKDGHVVFETKARGISSILAAIDTSYDRYHGASVADRVVGKAIAMLYVYAGVKAIYATTLSRMAKHILEEAGIFVEWMNLVENVLNPERTEPCPFETAVERVRNPKTAYRKLKTLQGCLPKSKQ